MKKVIRIVLVVLAAIVFLFALLITYVKTTLPDVGKPPELHVEATPARLERGRYLAHAVAVCMDCHSSRDWSKFAGPMEIGTEGQGGEAFTKTFGFPGNFYAKNITPYGLKDWTDGELYRCIATGVTKDGGALFPVMPYHNYGQLANEDLYSIIAYIKTLKPIAHNVPEREIDFPMNIIIHTIPTLNTPAAAVPAKTDTIEYGHYLLTAAACGECHTKQDKGKKIEGMEFSGGFEFPMKGDIVIRSANITPHASGLGNWTKEQFIQRFKKYADSSYVPGTVKEGGFNTVMPWMMYKDLTVEDLGAMYEYLRTLKPIENEVEKNVISKTEVTITPVIIQYGSQKFLL